MKMFTGLAMLRRFQAMQRGVFSIADLVNLLGEKHPAAVVRRLAMLQRAGVLARFTRGFYVTPEAFDLSALSQRLAPESYLSFGTALARHLLVGPTPERHIYAAKAGRSRTYEGLGCRIVHLGMRQALLFGFHTHQAVHWATAEKALLDTLYFHLRGRRYPFDIYTDLRLDKIDRTRTQTYLQHYKNPKFGQFVAQLLHGTP